MVTLGGPGKRSGHKKPVPAAEIEVKFKNAQSGKTLAGTLIEVRMQALGRCACPLALCKIVYAPQARRVPTLPARPFIAPSPRLARANRHIADIEAYMTFIRLLWLTRVPAPLRVPYSASQADAFGRARAHSASPA